MRTSPEVESIKTYFAGRRKGYLAMILVGVLLLVVLVVARGGAVHDLDLFELDRNAEENGSPDGDDWDTLYDSGANTGGNSVDFTGILPDIGADGGTQFHGGGSKDDLDITQWRWQDGEPLDKDDITNAYAAAYVNTQDTGDNDVGDLIVYFGLDRFSATGSAQVGFWFLQDPSFGLTNTFSKGGFKFSGAHVDNDVLVQSNFSNGGVINNITVYKWQAGALVQVLDVADCLGDMPLSDDPACATVNQSPQTAPWPYTPKANEGDPGTFLTSAFFEGGINISRLVPAAGCFTGFVAETRSSTPFDARLKDFVLGEFNLCSANIQIEPDDANQVGTAHDFTVTVNQVVAGVESPVDGAEVTVDFTGTLGATPSPAQDTCTTDASGECTVTVNSTTTGLISAHASTTIEIFGDSFTAETDGVAPNSDDALKRYVDARLTLTPPEDANQVGNDHPIMAHLEFDYGDGDGFVDAPAGETINFAIDSGPGSLVNTSCNTDANGECEVTLQSTLTGETAVSASWSGTIATAEGNASAATEADPVDKRWVDARLSLSPEQDANQVGTDHIITALLEFDYGDGDGFVTAPAGETINFAIDSGPGSLVSGSCNTDANGECQVTLQSNITGLTKVSASWSGDIHTLLGTASATASADPVDKRWVDARLTLTPEEDANQVGTDHLIKAHLEFDYGDGAGFVDAPAGETINFAIDSGPGSLVSDSCDTDADGECQVTLQSDVTGLTVVSASWSGIIATAEGDASASTEADPVDKRWVDARLTLTPPQDANQVGSDHIVTALLEFDFGDGNGFVAAPDGETINLATDFGTLSASSCDTDGGDGNCTVTLTSAATGLSTISGSWSGDIVTAEGTAEASAAADDVFKRWVDARLTLTPLQDANQVGTNHIITAHLEFDYGDGGGFVDAPDGETITFSIDSGPGSFVSNSCVTAGGGGTCSVTLQSGSTGLTTVSASWTGGIITAEGTASASASASPVVKRWVNARLTLTPEQDDNGITEPHDIVAKLEFDTGSGFVAAPDGETINLSTDFGSFASDSTVQATTCDTAGGTGECTVTLYSDVEGTANITANWSGTIGTAEGSAAATAGPATASKTWIDGSLRWFKHDNEGNPLGGATFEVQRIADRFGDPVTEAPITVVDNGANDNDSDHGVLELIDLLLGTYTVQETQEPEGYRGDLDRVDTVTLTLENPDVVISEAWVNVPIGRSQLTPTGTECEDFVTETATDLETLTLSGGGQLSPGAFIYFSEVSLASGSNTIEVSVASDPGADDDPQAFDVKLYTFDEQTGQCQNITNNGDVSVTLVDNVVTYTVPGSYGDVVTYVKYKPPQENFSVGTTYTFTTRLNGTAILSDSLTVVE